MASLYQRESGRRKEQANFALDLTKAALRPRNVAWELDPRCLAEAGFAAAFAAQGNVGQNFTHGAAWTENPFLQIQARYR